MKISKSLMSTHVTFVSCSEMGKMNAWSEDPHTGALKFNFPSLPRLGNATSTTESESIGNLFMIRLLEVMHNLGYEFILSSDLTSIHGQSSLFFKLADHVNFIHELKTAC